MGSPRTIGSTCPGGGCGFLLGDGRLDYFPEEILEVFYRAEVLRGLSASPDFQFIDHPAYNRDRGPVSVFSVRLHYEY